MPYGCTNLGYNLMLYGVGSKLDVLNLFAQEELKNFSHLFIKGYDKSLTYQQIVSLVYDMVEIPKKCTKVNEMIKPLIKHFCSKSSKKSYFIIIHSFDSFPDEVDIIIQFLIGLVKTKCFHILCSVDKLYSGTAWSEELDGPEGFNWARYHTPTNVSFYREYGPDTIPFLEYEKLVTPIEAAISMPFNEDDYDEPAVDKNHDGTTSPIKYRKKSRAVKSLDSIYTSLTTNSKKIFEILANFDEFNPSYKEDTLTNQSNPNDITLQDLLKICREEFLVSNESGLRTHLREFLDHNVISLLNDENGLEKIHFEMNARILKEFFKLNEISGN